MSLAAAAAVAGFALAWSAWRLAEARALARASEPFARASADDGARLLVVGDSTAVGTGARSNEDSVAGRVAARFPALAVENRGQDGARLRDVVAQLEAARGRYALVLIQAGGNDVIRLTGDDALARDVDAALARAAELAPIVVIMPAGNVGIAPFFWPPASWWMSARARTLHDIVREAAARRGAVYVNLYRERGNDPFARDPARMYARDGLHPSSDGYAQWTDELLRQAPLDSALAGR